MVCRRLNVVIVSVVALLASASVSLCQQAQSQSVAEAAKRAKEAKKNAPAKSKVITDDDLGTRSVAPDGQAPASPSPSPDAAQAQRGAPATEADTAKEKASEAARSEKEEKAEIARLKADLARAEQDLDLTQRETALARDSYYSNPDHSRDTNGKAKLDALQQQIAEKQRSVQELRDRLAAKGVKPSSSAPDSTQPAPPQI